MRKLIPLIALVAFLVPAGSAFAAVDVSVDTGFNELAINGDGEANTITVDAIDADTYQVADPTLTTAFTAGDGCSQAGANAVLCDRVPGEDDYFAIRIFGGDGGDMIAVGYAGPHNVIGEDDAEVYGEGGADKIGGTANHDALSGGEGDDVIDGAAGDDTLEGNDFFALEGSDPGSDELYGGPGSDYIEDNDGGSNVGSDILDGGSCDSTDDPNCPTTPLPDGADDFDTVSYFEDTRTAGVSVDLSTTGAVSGAVDEDDTTARFESVEGTEHADQLAGTTDDVPNEIYGYAGDDNIHSDENGSGDYIDCGEGPDFEPSTTDNDTLVRDTGDENDDCESVTPPNATAPPVPTGLSAQAAGDSAISLSWNPSANADTYGVWIQIGAGPDDYALVEDVSTTSYLVTGLAPGTQYCFVVDAGTEDFFSDFSAPACATTTGTANSDTDGDGLVGEHDECPVDFGPASNNGCPELPGVDEIVEHLTADLGQAARKIVKAAIVGLIKKNGYSAVCQAVLPGRCEQSMTAPGAAASTVIAKGSKTMTAAGSQTFKVKLTKKGKKRLKKARKAGKAIRATLTMRFVAANGTVGKKTKKVTLKAPKKKKKKKK